MPAASSSSSSALVPPAGAGGFVPRSVKVKRIAAEDDHESYLKVGDEIRCKNHNGKISKAVVISVNPLTVEVKTNESSYKKMLLDEDEDEEGEFLKMDLLDDVGKDSNSDNDLPGDEGFLEAYGKRKQNNIFQPIRGSKILRDVSKQMTKEKFLKHAAPLQISINGEDFLADAREFNSHEEGRTVGNAGWHGDIPNNEFEVEVAGVKMNAAVNVNIVVYKSYEWKITQESWVELFLRSIPRLKFESGSQEGKGLVWLEPDYSIVAEDHKKLVELMRIHNGGKKFWTATMVANFLQDDAVARIAKANGKPMPQRSHVTSLMTKCGGEKDAKGNWKGVRNNNAPGSSGMQKSLCEMLLQPRLTEAELRRRNEYWESLKKELDDEGHERFGGKSVKKTKKFYWCAKKQELVDDPEEAEEEEEEEEEDDEKLMLEDEEDSLAGLSPGARFDRLQMRSLKDEGLDDKDAAGVLKELEKVKAIPSKKVEDKKNSKRPAGSSTEEEGEEEEDATAASKPKKIIKNNSKKAAGDSIPEQKVGESDAAYFERLQKAMM